MIALSKLHRRRTSLVGFSFRLPKHNCRFFPLLHPQQTTAFDDAFSKAKNISRNHVQPPQPKQGALIFCTNEHILQQGVSHQKTNLAHLLDGCVVTFPRCRTLANKAPTCGGCLTLLVHRLHTVAGRSHFKPRAWYRSVLNKSRFETHLQKQSI